MSTNTDDFFDEPLEQSRVKARIVSDYVVTFGRILSDYLRSRGKAATVDYVDLFSGPGSYGDGTASTPLLVIRTAINDPKLAPSLRTHFNDNDKAKADCLRNEFASTPGIENLTYKPVIYNEEASIEFVERLGLGPETPKLFFLDPFGYKALTMPLMRTVLEGWAECIFFFNYRRVNAAISNSVFQNNVEKLFGADNLKRLKQDLEKCRSVQEREGVVLKYLTQALINAGAKHVLKFSFRVEDDQRSTHHLIFATGHRKGYEAMKTIMASQSTRDTEDGPSMTFTYRPTEPTLFDRSPDEVLAETLLGKFEGRALSLDKIYEEYGLETSYTQPYFRRALLLLEKSEAVEVDPPAADRPSLRGILSMAGNAVIKFPRKPQ